ncbi:MAG: rRNA maturation RNase YbeY [Coriobacteriales bacterium]|jgi:probable rRNA maturation factor|nr:rRNA maturation RNase YbeY [Coriobacteriales bacterium]
MHIAVHNRSNEPLLLDTLETLAQFVLTQEHAPAAVELAVSLVSVDEIHGLNRRYRNIDAPTDVLSFECDDANEQPARDGEPLLLGDVIIAPAVAREHARDFNSTFDDEMALMLTHGILHLLGYDHLDDREAEHMEARENELLALWGVQ